MNRYLIIGKSPQMCDVFLKDANGLFRQHKFISGKKMEITEKEMTFHVIRQEGYGLIQVVKLDPIEEEKPSPVTIILDEPAEEPEEEIVIEEKAPAVHIEETESVEAVAPPRKRRKRKKLQT